MIKAVAQTPPTFIIMSVFKLHMSICDEFFLRVVCDELTRMIREFWWRAEKGKRETHRVS
jgi:hypothetical protein